MSQDIEVTKVWLRRSRGSIRVGIRPHTRALLQHVSGKLRTQRRIDAVEEVERDGERVLECDVNLRQIRRGNVGREALMVALMRAIHAVTRQAVATFDPQSNQRESGGRS